MAFTYLFFHPARLPLEPHDLAAGAVLDLADTAELRAALAQGFPGLQWTSATTASATVEGQWYELQLPCAPQRTLALRCSLRASHAAFVQQLCDRFGWVAFDEQPLCYQPHRPPMPA